jgi:hypothetical protein
MRVRMRPIVALFLMAALATFCAAQTAEPSHYFAGVGAGVSRAGTPQTTGWGVVGYCTGGSLCPFVEFDNITGVTTTLQPGIMQRLACTGALCLDALGQAGVATTAGDLLGALSGGMVVRYDLGARWAKLKGLAIAVPVKAVKISGTEVHISAGAGLVFTFGVRP